MVIKNLSVKTEHDQCITTHYNKNNDLQGLSDFVTVQRQVSPYQAYGELFNRYTQSYPQMLWKTINEFLFSTS